MPRYSAASAAVAERFGREGYYFNQEGHGCPTDLPWANSVEGHLVLPICLYECIWCFLLFLILVCIDNKGTFHGQTFLLYGMLYSVERFFVESLRTDSLMIGDFKAAQIISIVIFVLSMLAYIMLRRRQGRKNRMFY